ncbi:hypothetical protein [Pseudorhodobacter ferrugineus]|nr:hypothetical protein [Pseudorhodobacter ferrugineus]
MAAQYYSLRTFVAEKMVTNLKAIAAGIDSIAPAEKAKQPIIAALLRSDSTSAYKRTASGQQDKKENIIAADVHLGSTNIQAINAATSQMTGAPKMSGIRKKRPAPAPVPPILLVPHYNKGLAAIITRGSDSLQWVRDRHALR